MTDFTDLTTLSTAADNGADQPASPLDRMRAALLDTDAVRALPPPDPLIADYLMRDSLVTLYGPSGGGKTFLALDWTLHTARFPWWNGHAVNGGPTIYVIAEGVSGVGIRIDAWTGHHATQLGGGHPIHWLPRAVNLTDLGEVYAFAELAGELQPVLIVFDTLARCIAGADENSAKDMGIVVANLDRIRRTTAACVLVVHHSGMDLARGARGVIGTPGRDGHRARGHRNRRPHHVEGHQTEGRTRAVTAPPHPADHRQLMRARASRPDR
jgi:RecA-family ATPase